MSIHRVRFDRRRPLIEMPETGHNRWHPDIKPILHVNSGDVVELELRDGLDLQIGPDSEAADVMGLDFTRGHALTGPIYVEGADPGDVLDVEILQIRPDSFGHTMVFPGFGLAGDLFDQPYLVKWRISPGFARSDQLPGVVIRAAPFLGVMGVAPSAKQVAEFTERETQLANLGLRLPLPEPKGSVPAGGQVANTGLRTGPPREIGGNMDIKELAEGSLLRLPVAVPGALFSAGDPHFAQGDGEVTGSAIEMAAVARLRLVVTKHDQLKWRPTHPTLEFVRKSRRDGQRFFATTGIPVDANGANHWLDLRLAARNALEQMLDYLTQSRGYSRSQAFVIASVAVDLKISEIVNTPNALVTAVLPLDIFEQVGST